MLNVEARAISIRTLLEDRIYTLGFFQREYLWEKSHAKDLLNDLFNEFELSNCSENAQNKINKDITYFLGSVIISKENEKLSLIDGQQRITTILLILIRLHHNFEEDANKQKISSLIFTERNGEKKYTLDAPDRDIAMNALYHDGGPNFDIKSESIKNICTQFENITEIISDKLAISNTENFMNWLIDKVQIVEIKTSSKKDGYTIFETANDRGLDLKPADMLKSYLLSQIDSDEDKNRLNDLWKNRLNEFSFKKESFPEAIKSWLRARYSEGHIDFEDIGSEFHRWVRKRSEKIGLNESKDFLNFIQRDFIFYIDWYLKLSDAGKKYTPEHEAIYCNKLANFNLQYQFMLAAIAPSDMDDIAWKKVNLVATFVDIFINRKLWSRKSIGQRTAKAEIRPLMEKIRNKSLNEIAGFLRDIIDDMEENFTAYNNYSLSSGNKKQVRFFLARFSAWLDSEIYNIPDNLPHYLRTGVKGFDIEHVIPNNFGRYQDDFNAEDEFKEKRNLLGALLLLPSSFNKSFGGKSYEDKLPHYSTQKNPLAQSLHESFYSNNPDLYKIKDKFHIQFQHHEFFSKREINQRQEVYAQMAKAIWSAKRFKKIVENDIE